MNDILTLDNDKNNCLRKKSEIVEENDKQKISELLKNKLKEEEYAVGLALPQLGINKRAIGIKFIDENIPKNYDIVVLFNPKISQKSKKIFIQKESCLSIPNKNGDVERFFSISIGHDSGIINFQGFYSAVVQHEIDHLDGILFIDKAKNIQMED